VIRVLLVDDQELVRTGIALLAVRDGDISVAGEAANGVQAVRQVRELAPDVVLMDLQMPVMDGIAATGQITSMNRAAETRVLVLTTFRDEDLVLSAIRAGASGYLLKDAQGPALRQAIRDVASGDSIADPSLTRILFNRAARTASRPELLDGLSERETQVLKLVGHGFNNAEIAEQLVISPETARTYVSRLRGKLQARDRAQLVVTAYESGLVAPGQSAS